jgi:hypothetical protein
MSHTYALLEVSVETYSEIREKLEAAGYTHAFDAGVIDMHGLALVFKQPKPVVTDKDFQPKPEHPDEVELEEPIRYKKPVKRSCGECEVAGAPYCNH